MKKKEKLALSVGDIDEKYVEEAGQTSGLKKSNRKRLIIRLSVIAAVIALLMAVLFVPFYDIPPSVAKYSGSEYYPLIQKLNDYNFRTSHRYSNNFELLFGTPDGFYQGLLWGAVAPIEDGKSDSVSGQDSPARYMETTDNQVSGVIEADRIKMTDNHIFFLKDGCIESYSYVRVTDRIYEFDGYTEGPEEVFGDMILYKEDIYSFEFPEKSTYNFRESEFYLSPDGKTLTVILPGYSYGNSSVAVLSFNVSNPNQIRKMSESTVAGSYVSSRMVNDELLLFMNFRASLDDFSAESRYLPHVETRNGYECIPYENIICPGEIAGAAYTVIYRFGSGSKKPDDQIALLSFAGEIYVSNDNIYIASNKFDKKLTTEIVRVSYGDDKLSYCGSVSIDGTINDQYSMDEYGSILRAVTTVKDSSNLTSASLYCIDINEMKVLSAVERFAPVGEEVKSVRFDKNSAYVCTAKVIEMPHDPVFFFDLSDIYNITCTDTGTIPGYSMSLVDLGDGFLLGIGYGEDMRIFKAEVYKEEGGEVVSVAEYTVEGVSFPTEYKAYFIDREHGLLGFAIGRGTEEEYKLLRFDGEKFVELMSTPCVAGYEYNNVRGILCGIYFFVFDQGDARRVMLEEDFF